MAARGSKSAQQRTEAERARLHTARKEWHDGRIRRRVRDNTIASIAGAVIVLAAIGSQVVHAQVAPTAPEPTPTPTVEPTDAPTPSDTTAPEPMPTESPVDEAPAEETPAG
ncbi:hypothetical protein [Microbacterium sp. 3J1]|uniref:hypothetical protein n=1 Tax=Microbacterium sp. 3J1 TaxID=861269 RepID=UPI000B237C0D|nr:hypothetical protein [Microbacterium sp. 3J1]